MGHSTFYCEVKTTDKANLKEAVYCALDNFRDEEGSYADAREGAPYVVQTNLVSRNEAYKILGKLEIRDGSSTPLVPFTYDIEEENATITLKVTKDEYVSILRWNNASADYSYLEGFAADVISAQIIKLPETFPVISLENSGEETIEYIIKDMDGKVVGTPYSTLADAQTNAEAILNLPVNKKFSKFTIEAQVRKNGNAILATIERAIPDEIELEFSVTTRKPKKDAVFSGYYVAFDYLY